MTKPDAIFRSSPGRPTRRHRQSGVSNRKRRGAFLLEVLVALTIFVMAAAVVASAMRGSIQAVADIRQATKAASLAESVLAELSIGTLEAVDTPPTAFEQGHEGGPAEGAWSYEIAAEDVPDVPGLKKVTITVTDNAPYRPITRQMTQWMLAPNAEPTEPGELMP